MLAHPFDTKRGVFSAWAGREWSRILLLSQGIVVRVENAQATRTDESRLYVANHASYLDPPAVSLAIPVRNVPRYVLKRELMSLPLVGWYARLSGHFPIDRSNPREGRRLMEQAAERCKRLRLSGVIFPEGTRSLDGRLGPIRPGAFELAMRAQMPVHPMAVLGTETFMPKGRPAPLRSGVIRIVVGEPIDTTEFKGSLGRKKLALRVREALLALGVPDGLPPDAEAPTSDSDKSASP